MGDRYEIQEVASVRTGSHFRITDTRTDSRVATCYHPDNAKLVVDALNAAGRVGYAIALQRSIEHHVRGEEIPSSVRATCPHHAELLDSCPKPGAAARLNRIEGQSMIATLAAGDETPCDHASIEDLGNGWGRCRDCGDDGFPISAEAAEKLRKLRRRDRGLICRMAGNIAGSIYATEVRLGAVPDKGIARSAVVLAQAIVEEVDRG